MQSDSLLIDEYGPLPVRRPASVAELCDLVKEARGSGQGVYPVGGRTMLDVGLPPIRPGFAVDTTVLSDVIDYPARDMTITVRAGITLARLQQTLATENQWLPVDVPAPEMATIGGAVALNVNGPRRFSQGTLRDYVIGISFVSDEGVEVKAGGRVVKNVAGYDLMKLQIGAVGTLGVVSQLTLKVKPRPEAAAGVVFGCDTGEIGPVLDALHASKSRPAIVELLNRDAWRAGGMDPPHLTSAWVLAVGFEEKAATVEWQVSTLLGELKTAPVRDVTPVHGSASAAIWSAVTALQRRPESRLIWKASVPPSRVAELVGLTGLTPYLVHAEALSGIVWFHAPEGFPEDLDEPSLPWLEQRVAAAGGNSVMRRCPTEWKRALPVWGRATGDRDLMRHVKTTLDPNTVFNPGRLFGDL